MVRGHVVGPMVTQSSFGCEEAPVVGVGFQGIEGRACG